MLLNICNNYSKNFALYPLHQWFTLSLCFSEIQYHLSKFKNQRAYLSSFSWHQEPLIRWYYCTVELHTEICVLWRVLRSAEWLFLTDVSGQPIGLISKGLPLKIEPTGPPETSARNYQPTLRKIPKEGRSHLHRGGSLKSRIGLQTVD